MLLPPELILIQGTLLLAVHAQLAPAVTSTVAAPPLALNDWVADEIP
jgi:hypothetical protein